MVFTTQASHVNHGQNLFESGLFSDCTVHCQNRSWKLHRAILTPRCEFFRACFTSGFQESIPRASAVQARSASNGDISVSMEDDEPQALDRMLRWMYTFSYPTIINQQTSTTKTDDYRDIIPEDFWTSELNLCITSDKYSMVQLLTEAASSILETARQFMSDPDSPKQCSTFLDHLDDLVNMLEILFTEASLPNLPFDLQVDFLEIMGDMISKHIGREERLSDLMTAVPSFGVMLVQVLGSSSSESTSDSDTTDLSEKSLPSPHVSTSTRLISDRRSHVRRKQQRSSSQVSSSSDEFNIIGRPTVTARRVYIPMNEDSDVE